jgi:hypothetical protein
MSDDLESLPADSNERDPSSGDFPMRDLSSALPDVDGSIRDENPDWTDFSRTSAD